MGFLKNKKILIAGIASKKSIAWGCATQMHEQGAELAFTYPNERLKGRIEQMAADFGVKIVLPCDVSKDKNIKKLFTDLSKKWDRLDGLVHSIAFADKEQLNGSFVDSTTKEGFAMAHDISSYSLTAMVREAQPLMKHGCSIVTMTYLGATRAIPHYNVMGVAKASLEANMRYLAYTLGEKGIRVNAISAGPVRTLAAAGISDFHLLLSHVEENAPLRRNITIEEVGNAASFLCSDLSSGITGEIMFVDSGFNMSAISPPR
ncbi:MAG: enoyl-[acyl-carrier-protein] reductase FabI [Gammaproteobacteria bacterium]|nr:MAG: enoyl-[acyl-carrier-protein] reductase FabI [Gammaproteobacteria bacterium]